MLMDLVGTSLLVSSASELNIWLNILLLLFSFLLPIVNPPTSVLALPPPYPPPKDLGWSSDNKLLKDPEKKLLNKVPVDFLFSPLNDFDNLENML